MADESNIDTTTSLPPAIEEQAKPTSSWWANLSKNIVDDPNAPELYSQRAVWAFSLFLAPLFGSVLMAMNFKRLEKPDIIVVVVMFGLLWYGLAMLILPEDAKSSLVYLFNMLGGLVLVYAFWPKFIGKELKYRKRGILVPTIIAAAIAVPFILLVLASK
jgi:hypothetical protein